MADAAAAQAAEMAHMASVRSLESASHSQVSSGASVGAGGAAGPMSSITGQNDIGHILSGEGLNAVTQGAGGMDSILKVGEDVNLLDVFEGNMAPGGIAHESIPPISSEVLKAGLQHTSVIEQTGAQIQGNTAVMSQGGGRE